MSGVRLFATSIASEFHDEACDCRTPLFFICRSLYSACGPFTKYLERIKKFRKTGKLKHLYRIELDKACFARDATYSDSKDLAKRIISDKVLKDRPYEIARNPNYDGY